jgi:hypothetical protein
MMAGYIAWLYLLAMQIGYADNTDWNFLLCPLLLPSWLCCVASLDMLAGYFGRLCYVSDYVVYAGLLSKLDLLVMLAGWLC